MFTTGLLLLSLVGCARPSVPSAVPKAAMAGPLAAVRNQELMLNLVAPAATDTWNLPEILTDPAQARKASPEEINSAWANVRRGAVTMTEVANLLVIPDRKIVPDGGVAAGGKGYLLADQIAVLKRSKRPAFLKAAKGLQDTGAAALAAANRRDVPHLLAGGLQIEDVCEACHTQLWYPAAAAQEK
jgi:hypothetical protein